MIEFLCPNGHKIRCGDERAGMAAKCPKCGVKFHIPTLAELTGEGQAAAAEVTEEAPAAPGPSGSGVSDGIVAGAAGGDDQIEFLCPNDHLLHGPLELQGQAGKCPECGSRFRIPTIDEGEYEEQPPSEPEPMPPPSAPESWKGIAADNPAPTGPGSAVDLGKSSIQSPTLASLFPLLWSKRAGGATLEIRYGDGQRLTPDRFFPTLSQGSHGMFAIEEPGASFSLITIAWESVSSVTVRGVKKLPDGARS